jgi:hypothetical protein
MCLPDFKEFKQIPENSPLIGYRTWKTSVRDDSYLLKSEFQDYHWNKLEGPHEVLKVNSGIYAYNNYYNYYNNYNNYNNNYYYYYNNNNNYYYYYNNNNNYLAGIIHQWGKTAIHSMGQRSEYAKIDTLFSIRKLDAKGPKEFLDWTKIFNEKINKIAEFYGAKVITWQDFIGINK